MSKNNNDISKTNLYDKDENRKPDMIINVIYDSENHVTLETTNEVITLINKEKIYEIPYKTIKMYCPFCGRIEYAIPKTQRAGCSCGCFGCLLLMILGVFSCIIPTIFNKRKIRGFYCINCKNEIFEDPFALRYYDPLQQGN